MTSDFSRFTITAVLDAQPTQAAWAIFGETGHYGTDLRPVQDNAVAPNDPSKAQISCGFGHRPSEAAVPLVGKDSKPVTCSLTTTYVTNFKTWGAVQANAPGLPDQTEYDKAWAACIELCDRVARGELGKMELRRRYPHEANSHRDMLRRIKTHGAIVCDEWLTFEGYLRTAGPIPVPGWTRDRIDPNAPEYSPAKTRWAAKRTQTANRKNSVRIPDAKGRMWSPEELGRKHGVSPFTIRRRRTRGGWSDADLIANKRLHHPAKKLQLTAHTCPNSPRASTSDRNKERRRDLSNLWDDLMREHFGPLQPSLPPADLSDLDYVARFLGDNSNKVLAIIIAEWRKFAAYAADMECSRQVPPEPSPGFLRKNARHAASYYNKKHVLPELQRHEREALAQSDMIPSSPAKAESEPIPSPKVPDRLLDHPMSFDQYDRELWANYRIRGTREQYEEGVVRWFDKHKTPTLVTLSLLPKDIQAIIITRKGIDAVVVEPPPADPNHPPCVFCPDTREEIMADPVEHSDPFPDDETSSAPTDTVSPAEEAETPAGGPSISRSPACSVGSDPAEADSSQGACPETEAALLPPTSPTCAPPAFPTTSMAGKPMSRSLMMLLGLLPGAVEYADGHGGKNAISCN